MLLNVLALGEETARSLGIDTERIKKHLSPVGPADRSSRVGQRHDRIHGHDRSSCRASGGGGRPSACCFRLGIGRRHVLDVADTIARTAFVPSEIPVGIMTALAGGPFFRLSPALAKRSDV